MKRNQRTSATVSLVNTMVKDRALRKANRKLDRQKRRRREMGEKLLDDPDDFVVKSSVEFHTKKIEGLKLMKSAAQRARTLLTGEIILSQWRPSPVVDVTT